MSSERIIKCFCGAIFIGTIETHLQHLHLECEVYAETNEILKHYDVFDEASNIDEEKIYGTNLHDAK